MMKFNSLVVAAAFGFTVAVPHTAQAEAKIYPYATTENFCPAGLRPVSINGTVGCGTPNQHATYQSVMAHPAARKKHHLPRHTSHSAQCEIGTKGCTFD
jgi:hypothetical protein